MKRFIATVLIVFSLAGCSAKKTKLPPPPEMFAAIAEKVELPEMVELPIDWFYDYYGIKPEQFSDAISYSCVSVMLPDEIVIIEAINSDEADDILAKLTTRLSMKENAAMNYFTETVASIQNGVIRQDSLTVSLLVSSDIEAILKVYDEKLK